MLKINAPNYLYCPFCKSQLAQREDEEIIRKYCPKCLWVYYPQAFDSVAAVITRNGKMLMVKRIREPFKNSWMFPGGFIEFGEHPEDTLKREVKEECGLKILQSKLIEVVQTSDDFRAPGNLVFFYKVKTSGRKIKTDNEENSDIRWFGIKKAPKIGWKSQKYILKKFFLDSKEE
ncbi:hypothetical protein COS78_04000 [Candidatus Shapirobacteria bacterium CG06_land_8_20_14_3_00_40_12]|uniref:Nudix hydrolase domain-containing protein n=1 Tax=Candidatus Shapirobacteria bacterium CG06_land_8_20_14_3_00_40_12 TaxID=1974881 RepID=A0A2M7AR70_9BACT|nr:MAG: hypothetical protein COS78_04000 [Candidatus Shapirobacteria bacterium CG06_land_8_20_14_3_00_40_12]